jgi:hypothetical protein
MIELLAMILAYPALVLAVALTTDDRKDPRRN